jgi:ribonuclease P protein component
VLAKKYRLKKRKDFARVYKFGKGIKGNFLFIKKAENNLNVSRFGIVVSKNLAKKATLRNKIKRRIREIIRANLPQLKEGFDVVIIALSGIEKRSFLEIKEEIEKLFSKSSLLTKNL